MSRARLAKGGYRPGPAVVSPCAGGRRNPAGLGQPTILILPATIGGKYGKIGLPANPRGWQTILPPVEEFLEHVGGGLTRVLCLRARPRRQFAGRRLLFLFLGCSSSGGRAFVSVVAPSLASTTVPRSVVSSMRNWRVSGSVVRRSRSASSSSLSQSVTSPRSLVALLVPPSAVRATASLMSETFGRLAFAAVCSMTISNSSGPTRSWSPVSSTDSSPTRSPLTNVPLRLFRSRTTTSVSVVMMTQCLRLTASLCGLRWHSSPRPIRHLGVGILTSCPALEPCRIFTRTCILQHSRWFSSPPRASITGIKSAQCSRLELAPPQLSFMQQLPSDGSEV